MLSSASVIHDGVNKLVMADETYSILKLPQETEYHFYTRDIAEQLLQEANRKHGNMLTVAVRPMSMFGVRDVQQLPNMLKVYHGGETNVQLGDNWKRFDFMYVGNFAYAHILALTKLLDTLNMSEIPQKKRMQREAFIATNDDPYHFWDYARVVWAAAEDTSNPRNAWVLSASLVLTMAYLLEWIFWLLFRSKKQPNLTRQEVKFCCTN